MGNGRLGNRKIPEKVDAIDVPLGNLTVIDEQSWRRERLLASDKRSNICVDPVSRQADPEKEEFIGAIAVLITDFCIT